MIRKDHELKGQLQVCIFYASSALMECQFTVAANVVSPGTDICFHVPILLTCASIVNVVSQDETSNRQYYNLPVLENSVPVYWVENNTRAFRTFGTCLKS